MSARARAREEDAILARVEDKRKEALDLLRTLISFDTTSGDQGAVGKEGAAQRWLRDYLEDFGMTTALFEPDTGSIDSLSGYTAGHGYSGRPNLVGVLPGSGGGRSIIVNSHMDTMPFGPKEFWTVEPLGGAIRDGKIYGRGACDAKGCLAAGVMAIKCLRELGVELAGPVILQSVVDEEGGGNGTLACLAAGYRADGAIVLEPTSLSLYLGHMGWMFFKIVARGRSTHAAIKWKGVSAIEKGLKAIRALSDLELRWAAQSPDPLFPKSTVNVGQLRAGTAGSVVPDDCEIRLCVHFSPAGDPRSRSREIESEVLAAIKSAQSGDEWLESHPFEVERYQAGEPYAIPPAHDLSGAMGDAIRTATGAAAAASGAPFGCDARLLANVGGIPTVVVGPGSIEQAHAIDEHLPIDEFLAGIKTLAIGIRRWVSP